WGNWFSLASVLIDQMGLNGHICPLRLLGAPYDLTCKVVTPPPYPPHGTAAESCAYEIFWQNDNIVTHKLSGRLSAEIFSSLPPAWGVSRPATDPRDSSAPKTTPTAALGPDRYPANSPGITGHHRP
ncbi:hypothetical protein C0993_012224, partial [Termitomyces sp. T159_Od127]